jgi:capsular polysaccharide biosynthesis protein
VELREYLNILIRRWWIPVVVLALAVVYTLASYRAPATIFVVSMRFTIGVTADRNVEGVDPILTGYQASEYIRDDFVEILHSEMFANDVNKRLGGDLVISKNNISGAVEKQRRIMSMTIIWHNRDEALKIADAAKRTLTEENAKYFAQLGSTGASVTIIDGPDIAPVVPGLREQLSVFIVPALGLLAGLALAFGVDYFDDSIHSPGDLEPMGLMVLAEIPREKRK